MSDGQDNTEEIVEQTDAMSMGELIELSDEELEDRIRQESTASEEVDNTVAEVPTEDISVDNLFPTEEVSSTEEVITEETPEEYEVLTKDSLVGKKAVVTYNKQQSEIDADELINLAQIGMHAGASNYKEAIKANKMLTELGVSAEDIQLMAKLKSGDTSAMKDIIAKNDLKLDDVRDGIYEFEQDDIDTARTALEASTSTVNDSWNSFTSTLDTPVVDKLVGVREAVPGLKSFNTRVDQSQDTEKLQVIIDNLNDGTWDELAPIATAKFLKLPAHEQAMINNNDDSFIQYYNELIGGLNQTPQSQTEPVAQVQQTTETITETPVANIPVSKRASVEDVSNKLSMGKPGNIPVNPGLKVEKKSAKEILNDIWDLDEHEEANYLRSFN